MFTRCDDARPCRDVSTLRVLLVTQVAFFPPYQGDSARTHAIVTQLRRLGARVCIVHYHDPDQLDYDYRAMQSRSDGLHIHYPTREELARRTNDDLDSWCPEAFVRLVESVTQAFQADVVLVQEAFLSRCLLGLPRTCARVIDATNVFEARAERYAAQGLQYGWFSTDRAQERSALARADLVIGIQESECGHFRELLPGKAVHFLPHLVAVKAFVPPDGHRVMFVGASNAANEKGLNDFIDRAWPSVASSHREAELCVGGRVGELVRSRMAARLRILGVVPDLPAFLASAAVVLHLAPVGTGLKIKTVDALCAGRCLVTTPPGIQGLENKRTGCLVADTPEDLGKHVTQLLSHRAELQRRAEQAWHFARDYFNPDSHALALLTRLTEMVDARRSRDRHRSTHGL